MAELVVVSIRIGSQVEQSIEDCVELLFSVAGVQPKLRESFSLSANMRRVRIS